MKRIVFLWLMIGINGILLIKPIKSFAQSDSTNNKIGFDFSSSLIITYIENLGYPLTGDIFYKYKRSKFFIGYNDYNGYGVVHPIYGLQGGYKYYFREKDKGYNWFAEALIQHVAFYESTTIDEKSGSISNMGIYDKQEGTYNYNNSYYYYVGIGVERKVYKFLSLSSFVGGGENVYNIYYPPGTLMQHWGYNYSGWHNVPSFIINLGLNFYLSIK